MKKALIVGCEGQDSRLLYDFLATQDGYDVLAIGRKKTKRSGGKWERTTDILSHADVRELVNKWLPDEIYYLAAYHHSSEDSAEDTPELFRASWEIHVHGFVNFLDVMRTAPKKAKLFYAASSRVFGVPTKPEVDEYAPMKPVGAYGITKASGILACRSYRQRYGVHASTGILFNHESELREPRFVTRKIVQGAVAAKRGELKKLILGSLSARTDWGAARDYVEAMHRILQLPEADDFVIASGKARSVAEFAEKAYGAVGLKWDRYVEEKPGAAKEQAYLIGDASKLASRTGWKPKTTFDELVHSLVQAELNAK